MIEFFPIVRFDLCNSFNSWKPVPTWRDSLWSF